MEQNLQNIKTEIKNNIKLLINDKNLYNAKTLLEQYKKLDPNDVEIYSIEAVIEIMKGDIEQAIDFIKEGLFIDANNADLLYNLAYIQELKNDFNKALKYYNLAYMAADGEKKETIKQVIESFVINCKLCFDVENYLNESKNNKKSKKVLILCNFYSPYMKGYMEKIKEKYNVIFDVLTVKTDDENYIKGNGYYKFVEPDTINKLYFYKYVKEFNNLMNSLEEYDVIHIHYLEPFYHYVADTIRNKCKLLITTIWGSDFYRTSEEEKLLQKDVINKSDIITFDNEVVKEEFIKYYGEHLANKCSINRFGLTALEYINDIENLNKVDIKRTLKIPEDSVVVQCGYNAKPAHNHLQMIDSIVSVKDKLPKNMFYIFPMTYGQVDSYVKEVRDKLEKSGLNYKIIENFMQFEDIAMLTKCTDIMIHLQTTDTLSATMQEHLYNGNIIITGSWLPYKPLKKAGVYFLEVSQIEKIGKKILEVVSDLDKYKQYCKKNKKAIWNFTSWEKTIENWTNLYEKSIKVEFDHKTYWNQRYSYNYTLESSGYMGLGIEYNKYLYKSRMDVLEHVINILFSSLNKKDILEIGPGTGYFTKYFTTFKPKNYLGIDISDIAIDNLSRLFKDYKFKVADISEKDVFINRKVDLAFASDVLLHLTDDEKLENAIKNIKNFLKDSGYYIGIEPITLSDDDKETSKHNRYIKLDYLKDILEKNNLELVDIIPVTFFMDSPFDYKITENGELIKNLFNDIYEYIGKTRGNIYENFYDDVYKYDKLCLMNYKIGLSNKLFIFKKKNSNKEKISFNIQNIWGNKDFKISTDLFNVSKRFNELTPWGILESRLETINPSLTVGIASYNNKEYLKVAIESILNQNYNNIKLLIVDDCSKDGAIDLIKEYTNNYPNIHAIYHNENYGIPAKAYGEIIEKADTKYFMLLNSDDLLYDKVIVKQFLSYAELFHDIDYLYGDFSIINENDETIDYWKFNQLSSNEIIYNTFCRFGSAVVPMNTSLFRTDFYKKDNRTWYNDEKYGLSDTVNTLVNTYYSWKYRYINLPLIKYRQQANNLTYNLKLRLSVIIPCIEYIIENFDEKIYFPNYDWDRYERIDGIQLKMFLVANYYYEMFKLYLTDKWMPWKNKSYDKYSIDELVIIIKKIDEYFCKCLNYGRKYEDKVLEIKSNVSKIVNYKWQCDIY